jgi:2,3-bisphosphoglycerate-independent phosphoglycerate mutase
VIAENGSRYSLRNDGSLQDIAPTMLGMLEMPQPTDMKGHDLRVKKQ